MTLRWSLTLLSGRGYRSSDEVYCDMTAPAGNGVNLGPGGIRAPGLSPSQLMVRIVLIAAAVAVFTAVAAPHLTPLLLAGAVFAVLSAAGIGVVISLRRKASSRNNAGLQRALDRSRRDYEHLFDAVPCFICVIGPNHRVLEANSLYRNEFGANGQSLCYQVCKKRATQCPHCIVDRTFADGKTHFEEETLVRRDGERINVVVHTRPVYDDHGKIVAVMEVFTDITEVKHLQRQLALMGRAVAGMAHRVKNILMGLDGGIFVVNTGLEANDQQTIAEGWEMVERNVQRVSGIVKDLLYCAKDRAPEFRDGVCPDDIVRDVFDLYVDRLADQGIELVVEQSGEPRCGRFDADGIHSLLCNLVSNAVDACRFDPDQNKPVHTITLRCRHNGADLTTLEVEDDGAGIPADMNDKVFEDFFSSKGSEGTGIGLLVVQKIAEEHGGKVAFRSSPGQGTTFTVTLPTGSPPAAPSSSS